MGVGESMIVVVSGVAKEESERVVVSGGDCTVVVVGVAERVVVRGVGVGRM